MFPSAADTANDNSFFCGFRARILLTELCDACILLPDSPDARSRSQAIHFRCEKMSFGRGIDSFIDCWAALLSFCPLICHTRTRFNLGRANECRYLLERAKNRTGQSSQFINGSPKEILIAVINFSPWQVTAHCVVSVRFDNRLAFDGLGFFFVQRHRS